MKKFRNIRIFALQIVWQLAEIKMYTPNVNQMYSERKTRKTKWFGNNLALRHMAPVVCLCSDTFRFQIIWTILWHELKSFRLVFGVCQNGKGQFIIMYRCDRKSVCVNNCLRLNHSTRHDVITRCTWIVYFTLVTPPNPHRFNWIDEWLEIGPRIWCTAHWLQRRIHRVQSNTSASNECGACSTLKWQPRNTNENENVRQRTLSASSLDAKPSSIVFFFFLVSHLMRWFCFCILLLCALVSVLCSFLKWLNIVQFKFILKISHRDLELRIVLHNKEWKCTTYCDGASATADDAAVASATAGWQSFVKS